MFRVHTCHSMDVIKEKKRGGGVGSDHPTQLQVNLGTHWLLIWGHYLLHGAPLAFHLGPQLAPGAPWPSPKGLHWLLI